MSGNNTWSDKIFLIFGGISLGLAVIATLLVVVGSLFVS